MLRLFPLLRSDWALEGAQAKVPITGANAKQVLFGAINLHAALMGLTPRQVRRKAGMASKHFRLAQVVQNFWLPTWYKPGAS
jgi:hypothetical protein